jgi:F-type H+-transporting ATPase subunit epsilon
LGALVENHTRIYLSDGTVQDLAVHGGFVDVAPDHVTILSDSAELAADINIERARTALQRAEDAMRGEHDATVESALRRAHARLAAAGGVSDTRAAAH